MELRRPVAVSQAAKSWIPACLSVVLAALALILLGSSGPLDFPKSPTWLLLIVAFAISEATIVHFEFRKQTVSWQTSEIPMLLGLFLVGPAATIIARVIALVIVVIRSRNRPPKAVFNVAVAILETALVAWFITSLGLTDINSPLTWIGAVVALVLSGAVSMLSIALAILITEGSVGKSFWLTLVIPLLVVVPIAAVVGVIVLLLITVTPWAAVLAVVILAAFVLLYRRYAAAAQDRRNLGEVSEFAELVLNTGIGSDGEQLILETIREKFNAAQAMLWIPAYLDQGPRRSRVSADGVTDPAEAADPDDPIRLEISAGQGARLVQRTRAGAKELSGLRRRDAEELIGVALDTEADEPGYLEVCDHNGSVLQFTTADVALMQSLASHVAAAVRRRQLQDKIRYDAAHDPVTDLPNRSWLTAAVDAQLANASARESLAILVADIDGFGQVNESLGHAAGDELLRVVAAALVEHAPPTATLARIGGSQFAVVLPGADLGQAEEAAAALRRAMTTRVLVSGVQLAPELIFGVAVAPLHGSLAAILLQRAEVAFEAARAQGESVVTYNTAMDEQSLRRLQLGADLADAINSPEISMVFQPIVGAGRGEIAAMELLTRWAHPRMGSITPDEFIPLAERIGLITPLTRRVLRTAIDRCQAWLDEGVVISMAVNLSPVTLAEPGFVDEVTLMLRERSFPPELLTFEITEGAVMSDGLALPALHRLHDLGVGLSVDDFGTGYSSLSRLRQLPIDEVKIDKSFVLAMSTDPGTNTIARSIIDLAHELGLRVVAEGVEDELTRTLLANMNCDFLQGYLVSRPLTERSLSSWLDVRTATQPVDEDRSRRQLYIIR